MGGPGVSLPPDETWTGLGSSRSLPGLQPQMVGAPEGPGGSSAGIIPAVSVVVRDAYSKPRCRPAASWTRLRGRGPGAAICVVEVGFPGRKGNGGAVTLNNVVYKPEIGLSGRAPEAAQGEGQEELGRGAQGRPPESVQPQERGRPAASWPSQGLWGPWLKQMAMEPSAEIYIYFSLKFTTPH